MPEASFSKDLNLPKTDSVFVKLKSKGDKLKFRIANTPHYETLHWISDREFVLCGKFNADNPDAECKYCDDAKKALDGGDKKTYEQIQPKTTFYYPVLNYDTGKPAIFQFTAKSIHYTIKGYADEGVDVFACDWSIERTEEKGNYYKVLRLGDKPLSKELQQQYELAKKLKLKASESKSVVIESDDEDGETPA